MDVTVDQVSKMANNTFSILMKPGISPYRPGQFITIHHPNEICPRPFCIFTADNRTIRIVIKVVGPVTEWLSQKKPGDPIYIEGPKGNGFRVKDGVKKILLVAGGIGIAPILSFAWLNYHKSAELHLLYGVKKAEDMIKEFPPKLDATLVAEDDSFLCQGFVTDYLRQSLAAIEPDQILACGPKPMLAQVKKIVTPYNIPCQVAMETIMMCGGEGHCLGCAIEKVGGGYFHLCQDGPIFNIEGVVL